MGVTAFTFVLLPLCVVWFMQPARLLQAMVISGVFEAAAALTLGGVGLQPGLMPGLAFLAYIGIQLLLGARYARQSEALAITRPFLLFAVWALLSSFLMPRLFQGTVFVWPQKPEPPYVLTALAPTSSNFNQDFYLAINAAVVLSASMFLTRSGQSLPPFLRAYHASGVVVAVISVWQLASKLAGVPFPDGLFYSNPGWMILTGQQMGNLPRINATFSEPSSLGGYMGGIVCSTGWLLLQGHRRPMLPWLFCCGLATMLLSTSSTGFAVLALVTMLVIVMAVFSGSFRMVGAILRIGLPLALLIVLISGAASLFLPEFNKDMAVVFNATATKQQSSSYDERTGTDLDSLQVAVDTFGLGAGWGSNRSSSLVPGLLASVGVPGCAALLWFAAGLTRRIRAARRGVADADHLFVIDGCCGALVGLLVAALLSGPTITSVTFFFLLALLVAAVVTSRPAAGAVPRRPPLIVQQRGERPIGMVS